MRTLKDFAGFVKEKHLDEFAKIQLEKVNAMNIPLMKLFAHLSKEQLYEMTLVGVKEFLTLIEENKAHEKAAESLRLWEADQLPGVPRDSIHPSDLVLVYAAQKTSLFNFLPMFSQDTTEVCAIINELEDYYIKVQDNAVQLLFKMQKNTKEKLKKSNLQLTEAQKISQLGNWEWNILENKLTWSEELFRIFGYEESETEMTFEKYVSRLHPEDKDKVVEIINESLNTKKAFDFYHKIALPGEKVKIIHSKGEVVLNKDNQPLRMLGTAQDVTILKKTEEELIRSNSELKRFAFIASHDLREPLRKIFQYTDRIAEISKNMLDEKGNEYLRKTQGAIIHMEKLIESILNFSKIPVQASNFEHSDLNSILSEVLNDLEISLEKKNAKVLSDKLPSIDCIPIQIYQLFQNLLSNSLKFTNNVKPPVIKIKSEIITGLRHNNSNGVQEKLCRIKFKDNGIGFDEKYLDMIFVLFQRLHSKDEYEGTGIGLSICKKIVTSHDGSITAESELNKGSTFTVVIPVKQRKTTALNRDSGYVVSIN